MGSSTTALSPFSPPLLFPSPRRRGAPRASSFPSLRPRIRRPNHLRRKLPGTQIPKPLYPSPPIPDTVQTLPPTPPEEDPLAQLLVFEDQKAFGGDPSSPHPETLQTLPPSSPEEDPLAHFLAHGEPEAVGDDLFLRIQQTHQSPSLSWPEDAGDDQFHFVEQVEAVGELVQETEGFDPFSPAAHRWFPRSVIELSLRFAVLLAVQTLAAAWLLSDRSLEDGRETGEKGKEEEKQRKEEEKQVEKEEVGKASEFERKVGEIRAMAEKARANERKDLAEGDKARVEVTQGLGRLRKSIARIILDENSPPPPTPPPPPSLPSKNLGGNRTTGKLNSRRKLGLVSSDAKAQNVAKGFGRPKGNAKFVNGGSGAMQHIGRHNPVEAHGKLQEPGEPRGHSSEETRKFVGVEDSAVSSKQGTVEKLECDPDTSVSSTRNSGNLLNDIEGGFSDGDSRSSSAVYSSNNSSKFTTLRDVSPIANKAELEIQSDQSLFKADRNSVFTENINYRLGYDSQRKQVGQKSSVDEDNQLGTGNKPWWMELQYVLAIFLRRGSDRDGPNGLYSLKMNSSSDDGSLASYTIAFQDRGDATNFCYLVESFFEDLGDVTADIVPLTVQELDKAVKSMELQVIVVRKGQLHLYAGQPLVEVESALRSLIE